MNLDSICPRPAAIIFSILFVCLAAGAAGGVFPADALAQQGSFFSGALSDHHEKECIRKGWQKGTIEVEGRTRKLLWKGPRGFWPLGAIVVFHAAGGAASDFCSNIRTGLPMVEFAEAAISQGFAVFSLDSLDNSYKGIQGQACGKRFNSFAHSASRNLDLPFVEKLLKTIIPKIRPTGSKRMVFLAGVSNGGFMTALAAAHYADLITGFAVVSAGDPFGTHIDCSKNSLHRGGAPGALLDNETSKPLSDDQACASTAYRHEIAWPESKQRYNPPFMLFYHEGDPSIDASCKIKLQRILVSNNFEDAGSFAVPLKGWKRPNHHLWLEEYNKPMIGFFVSQTRPAAARAREMIQRSN